MKKGLVILTTIMALLMVGNAWAAEGDICMECKCPLRYIDCPNVVVQDGVINCVPFDYDYYEGFYGSGAGWCGWSDAGYTRICKLIFAICNCDDPSLFDVGVTIGVKMTILTEGVYWDVIDGFEVDLATYVSQEEACEDTMMRGQTFGEVLYYLSAECKASDQVVAADQLPYTGCDLDADGKAIALISAPIPGTAQIQGYRITPLDVANSLSYWWIDVPPMLIDIDDITPGDLVQIKVDLLSDAQGGICGSCEAICSCVFDIGILCCTADFDIDFGALYFPYVLTQSSPWAFGIAVTNISAWVTDIEDATGIDLGGAVDGDDWDLTYTLTDATGDEFTWAVEGVGEIMHVWGVDAELGNFDGTPAAGNAWLRVDSNTLIDGLSFFTDGTFGAATLARQLVPTAISAIPNLLDAGGGPPVAF